MSDKNGNVEKNTVLKRLCLALLLLGLFTLCLESAQAATTWWNPLRKSPYLLLEKEWGRSHTGIRPPSNGTSSWRRRFLRQRRQRITEVAATASRKGARHENVQTLDSSISPQIRSLNASFARDAQVTT